MTGRCFLCRRDGFVHRHHIFEGARRHLSEEYGLVVPLCPECHTERDFSAHRCTDTAVMLKRAAQRKFERSHTREEFIKLFGRNYL